MVTNLGLSAEIAGVFALKNAKKLTFVRYLSSYFMVLHLYIKKTYPL